MPSCGVLRAGREVFREIEKASRQLYRQAHSLLVVKRILVTTKSHRAYRSLRSQFCEECSPLASLCIKKAAPTRIRISCGLVTREAEDLKIGPMSDNFPPGADWTTLLFPSINSTHVWLLWAQDCLCTPLFNRPAPYKAQWSRTSTCLPIVRAHPAEPNLSINSLQIGGNDGERQYLSMPTTSNLFVSQNLVGLKQAKAEHSGQILQSTDEKGSKIMAANNLDTSLLDIGAPSLLPLYPLAFPCFSA